MTGVGLRVKGLGMLGLGPSCWGLFAGMTRSPIRLAHAVRPYVTAPEPQTPNPSYGFVEVALRMRHTPSASLAS